MHSLEHALIARDYMEGRIRTVPSWMRDGRLFNREGHIRPDGAYYVETRFTSKGRVDKYHRCPRDCPCFNQPVPVLREDWTQLPS